MRDPQIEVRGLHVGQTPDLGVGLEPRPLADAHAVHPAREVGDLAGDLEVDIREGQVPVAQRRGEVGHVVAREDRPAQPALEAHAAEEVAVFEPRVADERDVGNRHVRAAGDNAHVLESEAAVGQVEAAVETVEDKAAALAGREPRDGGVDNLSVDGEVLHAGVDAVEVHVAVVDAEGGIAPPLPLQAEVHVFDGGLAQRQPEVALALAVGIAHAGDDLLDVHLPLGGLAQVEFGIGDLAVAQFEPAAEQSEGREAGVETPHVEERVALKILDVEAVDAHPRKEPDLHAVDRHGGTQALRHDPCGHLHDVVLHGGDVEQNRERHGKDHQQQHGRREQHSHYFHTFAHGLVRIWGF